MKEILDHINTKNECEAFIEEIKTKLKQLEGKQFKIELFFDKYAATQSKCNLQLEDLKIELAHINGYIDIITNPATLEDLQLRKLKIELKQINIERERIQQTNFGLAQKQLELQLLQQNIQFLNKVLTLAQKRKSKL